MSDPSEVSPDGATPISLSPPELTVLRTLRSATDLPLDEDRVGSDSGLPPDTVRGSLQRLRSKHLVVLDEEHLSVRTLTPRGQSALQQGLPERRFLEALRRRGGRITTEELDAEGLSEEERSAAIGILRRRQMLADGFPFRLRDERAGDDRLLPEEVVLKQVANEEDEVDEAILAALERRGLAKTEHRSVKRWAPSDEGQRLALEDSSAPLWGALTSADLLNGAWKGRTYRPYDVRAAVPYARGARENPYVAWLDEFADILVGLGFEETLGPLLETEFWNNDVLFMPQDHPARSIHDAFWPVGVTGHLPPADLLARVAAAHEGRPLPGETEALGPGWGGQYDMEIARRPVLRSQTTAVSARFLARRPAPPFRTFSIDRNFRVESVDASHHLEFQQCEGIVGEEGVTLRHLVGIFRELTEAIGIPDLKIRPSYFPFTEPSVEGYVRHPRLGWIEVLPGGLFRPEVLRPLGVEVPVAAWGIGVTRLAMVALGKSDIRELFCDDLDELTRGGPSDPVATLSAARLRSLLVHPPSDLALDDILFASKAEIESKEGDDLVLSVTPDRLDLLSEAGLSLHINGVTDAALGLAKVAEVPSPPARVVQVDRSVGPVRPYIAALVLHAPEPSDGLDESTLAEAIRFQELIHATIGRDRRAASLGIYPFDRLDFPLHYTLEPLAGVRFVPLDAEEEVGAEAFFAGHPMASRYGALGRVGERCLTLRDADGSVLSLPPILNGRTAGEARVGDRTLVLEATGTRERAVHEAVGLLLVVFAARGWSAAPVAIHREESPTSTGTEMFRPRPVALPSTVLHAVTGASLAGGEVERRLSRARLSARPHPGGWTVEVPPWRPDLLTAVDLAEDIVLIAGVRPEDGILLPSRTRGQRLPETRFRRRIRSLLTGLGYAEPHTPLLVSAETAERAGALEALRLRNPVSSEFSVLRDRLLLSHLDVLRRNTRLAYPQRFAEVGPVIVRSEKVESGGETRYRASAVVAADAAGFADAASWVDYLLRAVDVVTVREPLELPFLIPGRGARARVAGEPIAEMGEIHPRVLESLGVPVPVAWAEVDLTGLWSLVRRHEAH